VSAQNWIDLRRPRDLGALLSDGFQTYFRNFGTFLALAAVVVVPVQLILSGIGLKQLWAHYDNTPSVAALLLPLLVNWLVTTPLVTAMTIYALLDLGEGRKPSARRAISRGLEVFAPLFVVVLIAGIGIVAGFALLIVPGIFLAVRWYFVAAAVVVEDKRSADALTRSWALVQGSGWRVFGILIITALAIGAAIRGLSAPFNAGADAANLAFIQLIGVIVAQTLATPASAVIATLLYFDLRARREAPAPQWGAGGPGWPQQYGQQPPQGQPPWPQQPQQTWPAQHPQPDQPPGERPESPAPPAPPPQPAPPAGQPYPPPPQPPPAQPPPPPPQARPPAQPPWPPPRPPGT